MLRRVLEHVKSQNWVAVAIDLVVVVLGILLAFQIDTWHDGLKNRRLERSYLERLRNDLIVEKAQFLEIVERTESRVNQVRLLQESFSNPASVTSNPGGFVRALEQVTWRSYPVITAYTYTELIGSGQMSLIRHEELRRQLADYYMLIEETGRLGFGENDQDMFRNATVGLLTSAHLMAIEDAERYDLRVSTEEAVDIAESFRGRVAAHDWLPRLAKYQVLMRKRAEVFVQRADDMMEAIDSLLDESNERH